MRLTIGQASKLYNVSMDTLRYYHKEGIVVPEVDSENGYRYYTIDDLDRLSLVIEARRLDISVKEIKRVLDSEDVEEYRKLMKKQKKIIDEKMRELKGIKKRLKENEEMLNSISSFEEKLVIEEFDEKITFIGVDIKNISGEEKERDFRYVFDDSGLIDAYYIHYSNINGKPIYEEGILYIKYKKELEKFLKKSVLEYVIETRENGYLTTEWCGTEEEIEGIIGEISGMERSVEAFVRFKYLIPNKKNATYLCEILKIK
ncbi:MAG: MerR family transcriptional regulator [Clostridium sp.]|uniref:helix-turn-helix domain-containing protein n=1 Tax=Clostridium sp. TaxID=1506 RepID=UPI003F3F7177